MLCYRVAWLQTQGQVPDKEASMVKVTGDEVGWNVYNVLAHSSPRTMRSLRRAAVATRQ